MRGEPRFVKTKSEATAGPEGIVRPGYEDQDAKAKSKFERHRMSITLGVE